MTSRGRFITAAIILAAAAAALHPALNALGDHYTKHRIDILRPFEDFDATRLPSFEHRDRLTTLWWGPQDIGTDEEASFGFVKRTASGDEREVSMHLSYYSDPRHQVPHTPEVCFRQDGGVVHQIRTVELNIPDLGDVRARLVRLQRPGEAFIVKLYCFISNGRVFHDRERLRLFLGLPGDKYTYFSKVELGMLIVPGLSFDEAEAIMRQLLTEALPILMQEHLPSREHVRR